MGEETWGVFVGVATSVVETRCGVRAAGHRPLLAQPTFRTVGWVHWAERHPFGLLGPLSLDEVRARLGPGDRFDDPETPNRNRCERGHWYDEVLSGGCPWCA